MPTDVITYVREEVERQGHNTYMIDGITRVGWMLRAWSHALDLHDVKCQALPTVDDVIAIGRMVEVAKNKQGLRYVNVGVGAYRAPHHLEVLWRLEAWVQSLPMAPLDAYRAFEEIHPFVDGNGRTGKILLNWLNDSLLCPIFPPNDFWGRTIRNP